MDILSDIREVETPGKHGGNFFYAQIVYGNFSDIEKLKADGYSLATICKFLEKKGALPQGSDPNSFQRAFRREAARRQRVLSREANTNVTTKKSIKGKDKLSEVRVTEKPTVSTFTVRPKDNGAGRQVNPDNTFNITPVDPDDLPDII